MIAKTDQQVTENLENLSEGTNSITTTLRITKALEDSEERYRNLVARNLIGKEHRNEARQVLTGLNLMLGICATSHNGHSTCGCLSIARALALDLSSHVRAISFGL